LRAQDDKARLKLARTGGRRENARVGTSVTHRPGHLAARLAGVQGTNLLTVKNFLARFFSKIEVGYHTVRVVYTYPAEPNDG
jgi:hypothetical protein